MKIVNITGMPAQYTMGLAPDGRESAVVVIKGTFLIPKGEKETPKLGPPAEIITADTFTGEPGFSAPLYETDFAAIKPRCDVILNGSAYGPRGAAVERITVRLSVGGVNKSFDVVGKRVYKGGLMGLSVSPTEKFTVQPISYNVAFGGTDKTVTEPAKQKTYLLNHVGIGYHDGGNPQAVVGQSLPHTEETGKPITNPKGSYRPMAFGSLGRAWQPRAKLAGTYDQKWLDETFPFLPADYDNRYYQAAPEDQQTEFLCGNEVVDLTNLTPAGRTAFRIPAIETPVVFLRKDYTRYDTEAVCDTLIIEPDLCRFMMVWRATCPLKKNMIELEQAVVGPMSPGYFRAREMGKDYFPSLLQLGRPTGGEA